MRTQSSSFLGGVLAALALVTVQPPLSGQRTGSKIVVSSTRLLRIDVGGRSYSVFAETQNAATENLNAPQRWQFAVEPLLMPLTKATSTGSELDLTVQEFNRTVVGVIGGYQHTVKTRIVLPLVMKSDELLDVAATALTAHFKDLNYTFEKRQISAVPVVSLAVTFSDLNSSEPCKLVNPTIPVSGSDRLVRLLFDCIDSVKTTSTVAVTKLPNVDAFRKRLGILNGEVEITYDAKSADMAVVSVALSDVRKTKLYAELSGQGGEAYVSRDDLRNLGMDSVSQLAIAYRGRKMSSSEIEGCFIPQLMSFPEVSIEAAAFTKEMLAKTYNGKDLDPSRIDHTLNDTIDKSSSKDNVKFSGSIGGKALFGLAEANGSMSGEVFQERMAEHGVKVEFNGEKWVAKGLSVKQVNLSDLSQRVSRGCTIATVGDTASLASEKRQLILQP